MTPEPDELNQQALAVAHQANFTANTMVSVLIDLVGLIRDMQLGYNERIQRLEDAIVDLGGELPEIPDMDELRLISNFARQIEVLSPNQETRPAD